MRAGHARTVAFNHRKTSLDKLKFISIEQSQRLPTLDFFSNLLQSQETLESIK
jgi:hypothetical protein